MTSKEKLSFLIRCGLRFSSDDSRIMDIIREEVDKTPTTSEKNDRQEKWIPINEETIKTLQDHHYYFVAHKYFNTPMKAKYHNDSNKYFEVFLSKSSQIAHIFFESTDEITHFMELPELPEREEAEE